MVTNLKIKNFLYFRVDADLVYLENFPKQNTKINKFTLICRKNDFLLIFYRISPSPLT